MSVSSEKVLLDGVLGAMWEKEIVAADGHSLRKEAIENVQGTNKHAYNNVGNKGSIV